MEISTSRISNHQTISNLHVSNSISNQHYPQHITSILAYHKNSPSIADERAYPLSTERDQKSTQTTREVISQETHAP